MPYVGFEPTIPTSERAKTVLALDRSVTVAGQNEEKRRKYVGQAQSVYNVCS
jgi:hypothetical protein